MPCGVYMLEKKCMGFILISSMEKRKRTIKEWHLNLKDQIKDISLFFLAQGKGNFSGIVIIIGKP